MFPLYSSPALPEAPPAYLEPHLDFATPWPPWTAGPALGPLMDVWDLL